MQIGYLKRSIQDAGPCLEMTRWRILMYRLYCKIPRGLEPVANVFKQHVTDEGTALVQQEEDAVSNYVNFVVVLLHPIL
ncbi:hypothetical protein V6Z12_A02G152700 [Gossypium hirsutum]